MKRNLSEICTRYRRGETAEDIAQSVGVSKNTILRDLRKSGVKLRNPGAVSVHQLRDCDWLRKRYLSEAKSTTEIASELGCTASRVSHWLKRHGIEARPTGSQKGRKMSAQAKLKMSEAKRGKYQGAENPNWRGAQITAEVRERRSYIAKKWRLAVLARDKNICQSCGKQENLHVHHIKEFKDYPKERWNINNGLTLCVYCHEKVHNRRFPDFLKPIADRHAGKTAAYPAIKRLQAFEISEHDLRTLYEKQSLSTASIAELLEVAPETIRKSLKKHGIKRRSVGGRKIPMPPESEIRQMYPAKTMAEAAAFFGVGQTLMHKWLKHYGISRTKARRRP